ncbi:alpha-1,2-fucosyltransferase [Marinomonas sp. FW-1]|uniref:alpha-1,2-fucosyltransferase n=1 Tax=Marinomonas sp. FW-1 TaxID=2071621 RepID=UPI0010C08C21|nr:alpha-1,2-fucosyltransferase [Marinomonas sp. FW-1]
MIVLKISGGLGNQMFQYATARALASEYDCKLYIDLSFYDKQDLRSFSLDQFNCEYELASDDIINLLKGREGLYQKIRRRLGFPISRPKTYVTDSLMVNTATHTKDTFQPISLNRDVGIYLDGYWQNEKYFNTYRSRIVNEFQLKSNFTDAELKYIDDMKRTESVSLHVRRGDYVDNNMFKNSSLSITGLDYYYRSIEFFKKKLIDPVYYIFSDDLEWCKKEFSFLDNKVFIDTASRDTHELLLISQCKHNIIANSTFSWWGAWLNQNELKTIIAPKIWFKTNLELSVAPDNWVKI